MSVRKILCAIAASALLILAVPSASALAQEAMCADSIPVTDTTVQDIIAKCREYYLQLLENLSSSVRPQATLAPTSSGNPQATAETSEKPVQTTAPAPTRTPAPTPTPAETQAPVTPVPTATAAPLLTSTPSVTATPQVSSAPDNQVRTMVTLINQERGAAGLAEVELDSELSTEALKHSQDMSQNNFFSHTSPTRGTFSARLQASGIRYNWAGENIALYPSVQAAHDALMASDGHRANILHGSANRVGIGIVWNASRGGYYITQWFAAR
ncbi:MAG: CAP domain-containing protein [Eubacteriales bacterium]|nr:CAP domain-containing protein [Eubacteriales bacterium]